MDKSNTKSSVEDTKTSEAILKLRESVPGWEDIYLGTVSGRRIYIFRDIEDIASEIDIKDIAIGLSNMSRYSGQTQVPYSVAAHSIYVAIHTGGTDTKLQLAALLHDASEAYMADIPAPIKVCMGNYLDLEEHLMRAVYHSFGITKAEQDEYAARVKYSDMMVLYAEMTTFNNEPGLAKLRDKWEEPYQRDIEMLRHVPSHISPFVARGAFLHCFNSLISDIPLAKMPTSASAFVRMQLR